MTLGQPRKTKGPEGNYGKQSSNCGQTRAPGPKAERSTSRVERRVFRFMLVFFEHHPKPGVHVRRQRFPSRKCAQFDPRICQSLHFRAAPGTLPQMPPKLSLSRCVQPLFYVVGEIV